MNKCLVKFAKISFNFSKFCNAHSTESGYLKAVKIRKDFSNLLNFNLILVHGCTAERCIKNLSLMPLHHLLLHSSNLWLTLSGVNGSHYVAPRSCRRNMPPASQAIDFQRQLMHHCSYFQPLRNIFGKMLFLN